MTIRYLNCGTLRPYWPRIKGGVTCLLVDTNQGPVLVDTGFGLQDYENPTPLINLFMAALRVPRDPAETAYHQVQTFGFRPEEVEHIIMTHLHLDHAGGLPDFPWAQIHIYEPEYQKAMRSKGSWAFVDYHWSHGPDWRTYGLAGDRWFEFEAIRLKHFEPEIWMIPLTGHSPGHCGVAIRQQHGWLFYAADAVPFNNGFEEAPRWLTDRLLGPHSERINAFADQHPEIELVGAHMKLAFYADKASEGQVSRLLHGSGASRKQVDDAKGN